MCFKLCDSENENYPLHFFTTFSKMSEALIAEVDTLKQTVTRFIEAFKLVDSEHRLLEEEVARNHVRIKELERKNAVGHEQNAALDREP